MPAEAHDRTYLQARVREEMDRAKRYGREFSLLVFESLPSSDGMPPRKKVEAGVQAMASAVRPSDVVGRAYDDTIVVLLVETGAQGARDTLQRLRVRVARLAGNWQVTTYNYPHHEAAISRLPLLTAA